MAVARVTLTGCATYTSKYGQYVKNQSKVCTDLEEIKYYKNMEVFTVELLTPLEEPEHFTSVVSPVIIAAESQKAAEEKARPKTEKMTEPPKPKEDSLPEIAEPTPKKEPPKQEPPAQEPPSTPPPAAERGKKRRKTAI